MVCVTPNVTLGVTIGAMAIGSWFVFAGQSPTLPLFCIVLVAAHFDIPCFSARHGSLSLLYTSSKVHVTLHFMCISGSVMSVPRWQSSVVLVGAGFLIPKPAMPGWCAPC